MTILVVTIWIHSVIPVLHYILWTIVQNGIESTLFLFYVVFHSIGVIVSRKVIVTSSVWPGLGYNVQYGCGSSIKCLSIAGM